MHSIKYFVLPSFGVAVWAALVAGTLLGFGEFALATEKPAQVRPAPVQAVDAPLLTAAL